MDNVVALANTEKRVVALGLEDNGTVTGVGREHRSVDGLSVFIFFSKTVPQVVVRAEIIHADNGLPVACIEVDRNLQIVSSIRGGAGQRRLKADGTPEVVTLFPSRFVSRLSQLRNYDYSAQPARNHDWTTGILSRANGCVTGSVSPIPAIHCRC